jgi:hypothetical protein
VPHSQHGCYVEVCGCECGGMLAVLFLRDVWFFVVLVKTVFKSFSQDFFRLLSVVVTAGVGSAAVTTATIATTTTLS